MPPNRNPNGKNYDADRMAQGLADSLNLSEWRKLVKQDADTTNWAHIFEKIKPTDNLQPLTASLINTTNGYISPDWLHSRIVAAWTYGAAFALQALADEEITLFGFKPLEGFPNWDHEPDIIEMPEVDKRIHENYPELDCDY